MKVTLRPWTLQDIDFTLRVRNNPDLMKWFRQNKPITYKEQKKFIEQDLSNWGAYNGEIIEADEVPVGMCGVKDTGEFTLAVLPEHQHKGIATQAMKLLISKSFVPWSEVFVGNPALEWFISVLGFKVMDVKERAYYKPEQGLVDIVRIKHD